MATTIQVCNMALGHLGEAGSISSIDPPEGSKYAEDCVQFFGIARDIALSDAVGGFRFNTKRAALAPQGTPPDSWGYSYAWPGQCLHPLTVHAVGDSRDEFPQPFTVEMVGTARRVFTDVEDAIMRYTFVQEDVSLWTTQFALAVSYRLAAFLAGPIIKGSKGIEVSQGMLQLYRAAANSAMAQDASAKHDDQYRDFLPGALEARR